MKGMDTRISLERFNEVFKAIYSDRYILDIYKRIKSTGVEHNENSNDTLYIELKLIINEYIKKVLFNEIEQFNYTYAESLFNVISNVFDLLSNTEDFIYIYSYFTENDIRKLDILHNILSEDMLELQPFRYYYLKSLYNTNYLQKHIENSLINLFRKIYTELKK